MSPDKSDKPGTPSAQKPLDCDHYAERNGTCTPAVFKRQEAAARRAARAKAEPGALAAAMAAVAKWVCVNKKCPQLKYTIRLTRLYGLSTNTATVTLVNGTVIHGYSGVCSCDWRVRVECVGKEIEALKPSDEDAGVLGDPPIDE